MTEANLIFEFYISKQHPPFDLMPQLSVTRNASGAFKQVVGQYLGDIFEAQHALNFKTNYSTIIPES